MTFEEWKDRVNDEIRHLTGLECDDLPDMNYWDSWEDEVSPAEMVDDILAENGYSRSDF